MLVPGAAIIDRAAAGEAGKIADTARFGYPAAEFAISNLLKLMARTAFTMPSAENFMAAPPTLCAPTSSKSPSGK